MSHPDSALNYPYGDTLPDPGALLQICEGLFWMRLSLPFSLNHINVWLVRDRVEQKGKLVEGWCVIDTGIDSSESREAWESVFADKQNVLEGKPITRVVVTHCHPDHIGLAHWICEKWQVPLFASTGEYAFSRMMAARLAGADGSAAMPHFRLHGLLDPALCEKIEMRKNHYTNLVPDVPKSYHRICEGQVLQLHDLKWNAIAGYGHSPEHLSYHCERMNVMISGDMLLPRISTNVSVFALEPEANPLQQYLDSLDKFDHLPVDTLILPSHGKPFSGAAIRIQQLRDHHAERLAETLAFCDTPRHACELVPVLFKRELDHHQLTFAMGEALAHLHKLWFDGVLKRLHGNDGVIRFVRVE